MITLYGNFFPKSSVTFYLKNIDNNSVINVTSTNSGYTATIETNDLPHGSYNIGYKINGVSTLTNQIVRIVGNTVILPRKVTPNITNIYIKGNHDITDLPATYIYDVGDYKAYTVDFTELQGNIQIGDSYITVTESIDYSIPFVVYSYHLINNLEPISTYINGMNLTYVKLLYLKGRTTNTIIKPEITYLNSRVIRFEFTPTIYDVYDVIIEFHSSNGLYYATETINRYIAFNPDNNNPFTIDSEYNYTGSPTTAYAVPNTGSLVMCSLQDNKIIPSVEGDYSWFKLDGYYTEVT